MLGLELLKSLLVSLCLGALIGLERQWDEENWHPKTHLLAGLRTFTFWALLGNLCGYFTQTVHPLFFLAGFIAMGIWISLFLFFKQKKHDGHGYTTGAVGLLTYLIGGLVAWHQEKVALVLTMTVVILLALKPYVHRMSRKFSKEDVRMALQFAAITGVILPLVPNENWGPFEALNPHSIWMMVVLVSGASFGGYVAVRIFGQSMGMALTGVLGGVASSTATTMAMSRQSRSEPSLAPDCGLAIVLACTVMLWRVTLLATAVHPLIFPELFPWILWMSIPGFLFCGWRLWRHGKGHGEGGQALYRNPLGFRDSLQFAALYALILFAVKAADHYFGGVGLSVVSAVSGLMDLDAIALSLSQMAGERQSVALAIQGILIATVANTVLKGGVVLVYGDRALRKTVLVVLVLTAAMGAGAAFWLK